jgi:NADPH:quinone reductase-like Zn-dependent oxidoreductase
MKAIVCTRYGPPKVLQLKEVAQPAPKDDELIGEVIAHHVVVGTVFWLV